MKIIKYLLIIIFFASVWQCTKIEKGFISPTIQYSNKYLTIVQGRQTQSSTLVSDGSSIPLKVSLFHAYNSKGNIVDTMFTKTYPVTVWNAAYNSKTDTTYAKIIAKQSVIQTPAFTINELSGAIIATPATVYLPVDSFHVDLLVANIAGVDTLRNAITLILTQGKQIETSPEVGAYSLSRLIANTPTGATTRDGISSVFFNGNNNPFVVETITRVGDVPNKFEMVVEDRNGRKFNPKSNEIMKRPNSGLNPVPPFLQNLQDYAPDTFTPTDTSMILLYPLVPFPIASLGNGFNMYYRIPTAFVQMDSTTTWASNTAGNYYKGTSDSHYKGVFKNDLYDYSFRVPLRIQVPGSYLLRIRLLNTTHR